MGPNRVFIVSRKSWGIFQNSSVAITMDLSISWNFSNPKTQAKSRMNDKENDVEIMKIHQEIKKATLVQTFSIGIYYFCQNRSADKPQLCIVQHIPLVLTLCRIVYMHSPCDRTAINTVCAQMR